MLPRIAKLIRNCNGIAALEYALIAGLMFAVIVSALTVSNLGTSLQSAFLKIGNSLTAHSTGT